MADNVIDSRFLVKKEVLYFCLWLNDLYLNGYAAKKLVFDQRVEHNEENNFKSATIPNCFSS